MLKSDIARFPMGAPLIYSMMSDDFHGFTAANWTLTGAGAAAHSAGADGGVIALSTSGTINTEQSMAFGAPNLTITPDITKDLFVAARVQLDDVVNGGFFFGLSSATGVPLTTPPTNGIYFRKLTGTDTGQITVRVAGTNTYNVDLPVVASTTWYDLVIAYTADDGALRGYVGNGAVRVATYPTALTLGSSPLGLVFAVRNQSAAIRTLLIDNYFVAKAR